MRYTHSEVSLLHVSLLSTSGINEKSNMSGLQQRQLISLQSTCLLSLIFMQLFNPLVKNYSILTQMWELMVYGL